MTLDYAALLQVLEATKAAEGGGSDLEGRRGRMIGSGRPPRADDRIWLYSPAAGDLELAVPKLRTGSGFLCCWNAAATSCATCAPRCPRERRDGRRRDQHYL